MNFKCGKESERANFFASVVCKNFSTRSRCSTRRRAAHPLWLQMTTIMTPTTRTMSPSRSTPTRYLVSCWLFSPLSIQSSNAFGRLGCFFLSLTQREDRCRAKVEHVSQHVVIPNIAPCYISSSEKIQKKELWVYRKGQGRHSIHIVSIMSGTRTEIRLCKL